MSKSNNQTAEILRKSEVLSTVGISNSTLYAWMQAGEFPKPIKLGARAVGWLESEISEWIERRRNLRNGGLSA